MHSRKKEIVYIDRASERHCIERVYGAWGLELLYGDGWQSRLVGPLLAYLLAHVPAFSKMYGHLQKRPGSRKKIRPFIEAYEIDESEFAEPVSSYRSFDAFFTRHLKSSARPIDNDPTVAVIPADGRYLFYQNIEEAQGFLVKGEKFNLGRLLADKELAKEYAGGAMAIARLCPTDYHRYHFPLDCLPSVAKLINGWLYSVNPIAIKRNIHIFTENKRMLTLLESRQFGRVLFLEIGATFVGAIHQTYRPGSPVLKGTEKGYFSFGASSLILLFQPGAIQFDQDLLEASASGFEVRCLLGQSMGRQDL